jgi:hypothetical protein
MSRRLRAFFFLLICVTCQFAHTETITFDDLISPPGGDHSVDEYDGFYFYTFLNANPPSPFPNDNTAFLASGYYPFDNGVQYPYPEIVLNKELIDLALAPSFHSVSGQTFTLNSFLVLAFSPVPIYGVRQGVVVDETTTSAADSNGLLTLNWSDIDGILFPGGDSFNTVDIDTIVINEPTSTATIPEPSTFDFVGSGILSLVAAARRKRPFILSFTKCVRKIWRFYVESLSPTRPLLSDLRNEQIGLWRNNQFRRSCAHPSA